MYTASDLRKGLKIQIDGQPWIITKFEFTKPGKGQAIYRCWLKNMLTGTTMERAYRSGDRFEVPNLQEREMTYLYHDGRNYIFSDNETYEEVSVSEELLGDKKYFLEENAECKVLFFNDQPVDIEIPVFIIKEIVYTEPGVRGDTATNVTKPAKLDNDYEIQVPLFVNIGDLVKIDTRTGEYVERVKNK
ncbi:MAG: elongation factor P [Lentisphaerae bacterium]|nr:MAG: elongation factor P [Lentisphaerota bacterium]